mmetsp:Transcript_28333/g.73451  ORF Transcript_28333/g.73451 Transcript_28333/m.73451 type:complete len:215 (-) Transcript_28333:16-660(-)
MRETLQQVLRPADKVEIAVEVALCAERRQRLVAFAGEDEPAERQRAQPLPRLAAHAPRPAAHHRKHVAVAGCHAGVSRHECLGQLGEPGHKDVAGREAVGGIREAHHVGVLPVRPAVVRVELRPQHAEMQQLLLNHPALHLLGVGVERNRRSALLHQVRAILHVLLARESLLENQHGEVRVRVGHAARRNLPHGRRQLDTSDAGLSGEYALEYP